MKVKVVFKRPVNGEVSVRYGVLESERNVKNAMSLTVSISSENLKAGSKATIVSVGEFSFFLRDVNSEYPVFEPHIGAASLPENDPRDYAQVAEDVAAKGGISDFRRWEDEPEESFENAARHTRVQTAPTWLGLGPDIRGFWVDYNDIRQGKRKNLEGLDLKTWGYICPATHFHGSLPDPDAKEPYFIHFDLGPGQHCAPRITRKLEDGVLPILHATQEDAAILYDLTAFVTLERHTLSEETVKGTPIPTAYSFCGYHHNIRLPHDEVDRLRKSLDRSEEPILMMKVRARNISDSPAYAFFTAGTPRFLDWSDNCREQRELKHQFVNGACMLDDYQGKTVVINKLNDEFMPEHEMSVLVMPGGEVDFEMIVPNGPLSADRAEALRRIDFEKHYQGCRNYWKSKLSKLAEVTIPEKGIENRLYAGLLHMLLATTGEQTGPLMANVGIRYSPIGSESAPMILSYDWMGLSSIAARCIDYLIARQGGNGAIHTYSNYENETGPLLWTAGEHFKYTRDLDWLKRSAPALKKSCEYLLAWRDDNKTEEYRVQGCYGLQKGKVDDPDDFYHSFYLNAGSFAGLRNMAYALREIDPEYAAFLKRETGEYQKDIINAIHIARAKSPAIPLRGGHWIQHLPPWTEYTGDPAFHADGGEWINHGCILYRVLCNPPMYCGIFGVLDCHSDDMTAMLLANQSPHTVNNVSFCQPYYVRHDYAHAIRGEVKNYLKTFYNLLSGMQDRETYTMYEHFDSLPFKTHEEGWMLMQIRWMLFLEENETLHFFKCAPRAWFKAGEKIAFDGARSYFGKLRMNVASGDAQITCEFEAERVPEQVRIRLPHAEGRKAVHCEGGIYDPKTETVAVSGKSGKVTLFF